MKISQLKIFLIIGMIFPTFLNAQIIMDKSFKMTNTQSGILKTNLFYKERNNISTISIEHKISGLSVSGDILFEGEEGFVRIVLEDSSGNEYLVFETNAILENQRIFSFNEICEETALLNNIIPKQIKTECIDAKVTITEIQYAKENNKTVSANVVENQKTIQTALKVKKINEVLAEKELTWGAGETSLSKMTYMEKKKLFKGDVPNLAGFDYYVSGIYITPGYKSKGGQSSRSTSATTPFVSNFDWRNRHGRNWISPVKNQGSCGSCWAFGAVGITEAYVNLYYNRLLNMDLSEQDVLSCSNGGDCDGGYVDIALDYIKSTLAFEE
jgi:hypothetical protein